MISIDRKPDRYDWDHYVTSADHGAVGHLYGWGESLAKAYDLPIFRLAARKRSGGEIRGVLPLILFAAPGRDGRLISLPYTDAAGLLTDSPEVAQLLLAEALTVTREQQALHLELRQGAGDSLIGELLAPELGYLPHRFKVGLMRRLQEAGEALWQELPAKVRNQVRKARNCGCVARLGGAELLEDFYQVFSENMRDLGSPVHGRQFFSHVMRQLPENSHVVVVYLHGLPAAAAMVFRCNNTLYNPWASSRRAQRPSCPNMLLYWTMLDLGCRLGCTVFDFGRSSPGASTCRFKLQWGATMQPLTWHAVSLAGARWQPDSESLVISGWQELSLAESLIRGPQLRRWISL